MCIFIKLMYSKSDIPVQQTVYKIHKYNKYIKSNMIGSIQNLGRAISKLWATSPNSCPPHAAIMYQDIGII